MYIQAQLIYSQFILKIPASQAWLLCRLMPFMIGRFIPESDDHYKNYLLMLQITDYLLAPEISEDDVSYLKLLIEDHHTAFRGLYPQLSIIPKMHYILHTHAKIDIEVSYMYVSHI